MGDLGERIIAHLFRQFRDVLRVGKDRHPFAVLVRAYAGQPLEHLVTFDPETALVAMKVREKGAENRMRVQHRADLRPLGEHQVQGRFRGRLARARSPLLTGGVEHDEIASPQPALVLAARGYQQQERLRLQAHAVIAAGADAPAQAIEQPADLPQERTAASIVDWGIPASAECGNTLVPP